MKKRTVITAIITLLAILGVLAFSLSNTRNPFKQYEVGDVVDSLNGVKVYYNGSISNVSGRNVKNGYNIGKKYQCVEFVKRYYYEHLNHKMPDSYGHAKDFYNPAVADGELNKQRNLLQYTNGSVSKPKPDDLLVMGGGTHGHVVIVSQVFSSEIEIVQQNPGPYVSSRDRIGLAYKNGKWYVNSSRVLGWLRKE